MHFIIIILPIQAIASALQRKGCCSASTSARLSSASSAQPHIINVWKRPSNRHSRSISIFLSMPNLLQQLRPAAYMVWATCLPGTKATNASSAPQQSSNC
ncbi:hypothetical protein COO60DRAFT_258721 [Scenedesmus sp. NREL 46B-D3]|nr:hypothetical protein COO60DRAFT_258721 [Scenedesmus sp. NREL 46B-D3]